MTDIFKLLGVVFEGCVVIEKGVAIKNFANIEKKKKKKLGKTV
jgi:hypothetical protein